MVFVLMGTMVVVMVVMVMVVMVVVMVVVAFHPWSGLGLRRRGNLLVQVVVVQVVMFQ